MTQFDTVGMPQMSINVPVSHGLLNTNDGNPSGDQVSNGLNEKVSTDQAQGLSSNRGAYLESQSKPSTLK